MFKLVSNIFIIIVLMTGLSSCTKKEYLEISGSTTVLPIITIAAEAFKAEHPDINILVRGGGSGIGINQVGENKTHIGMTSRTITPEETATHSQCKFTITSIGVDAVLPVVSAAVYQSGITALSLQDISKIYSGKISNWQTLGGFNKKILCIDKEASRGTRHVFMQAIFNDKNAISRGADIVLGANNEEQTAITHSNVAIGMLSKAWTNSGALGLGIINDTGDTLHPTLGNIKNNSYPITRKLHVITNGKPIGLTKNFITFLLSEKGQKIVEECGYVKVK